MHVKVLWNMNQTNAKWLEAIQESFGLNNLDIMLLNPSDH